MQTRVYWKKLRDLENTLPEGDVVVVSKDTPDGGRAGVITEVPRRTAAQLLIEGRAELATKEQAQQFRTSVADKFKAAEQAAAAQRVQLTVVPESELKALRNAIRTTKQ